MPKSRTEFWSEKFQKNIKRDQTVCDELASIGVKILIVWECTVKSMIKSDEKTLEVLNQIETFLHSHKKSMEL